MILACNCQHDYQDTKHGKGQRVHNEVPGNKKLGTPSQWRCSVCGAQRSKNSKESTAK